MKWIWMAGLLICFALASAQESAGKELNELSPGALGTRDSSPLRTTTTTSPVGASNLLQMVTALGIVLVILRYGLPKLMKWGAKAGFGSKLDGEIRILETRAITGGSVHLIRVRGRLLLLSSTAQGIQLLTDLTEPRANHDVGDHSRTAPSPVPASSEFDEWLRQSERGTAAAVVPDDRTEVRQGLLTAAEQLKRLTGE